MIFFVIIFIIKTIQLIPNKGNLKVSCLNNNDKLEFYFYNTSNIEKKYNLNMFFEESVMKNNNACADFAIARGIVLAHGGHIRVESDVEHCIKFIIDLPRYM
jgi:K+-sensing histidine kinase KdpD